MAIADKLQRIAENEPKVYEAGRQAEYDEFWDAYQQEGNVYSAQYLFAQSGWSDKTFKPKYSQRYMTNAANMFNSSAITDLKGILEKQGVVFDFKNCANLASAFSYSKLTRIPVVSTVTSTNLNSIAYRARALVSIDEIILKEDGSQTFTSAFANCEALEEIRFSGVIGKAIDFQYSTKLSKASIESIINALSTTTSALVVTLSATAVNNAFETSIGGADGSTSDEWTALIATKSNWTITLV